MPVALDETLVARVVSVYPVPIADALAALVAADNPFEQRDRVVETFRASLRWLAGLAIAARLQFGPGPGDESSQLEGMLRALRSRGLTDGQWLSLLRELLRPWAKHAEAHPLPELVRLLHQKKARFPKLVDELLVMRKAETVAHGATGSRGDLEHILDKRIPQLAELLQLTDAMWSRLTVVLPVESGEMAEVWRGATPALGRFRRMPLANRQPPNQLVMLAEGAPCLALHPLFMVDAPSPGAVHELFTLDRGGKRGAVYAAFPSMAERTVADVWDALGELFAEPVSETTDDAAAGRPFRGLQSFGAQHADMFFGRERQAESLANRIRRVGMVTVTGPSGAGKSSLLCAGALPRVRDLDVMVVRPGASPLSQLETALAQLEVASVEVDVNEVEAPPARWLQDLLDTLPAELRQTLRASATKLGHGRRALVIDQAEELLTLCKDEGERNAFGRLLAGLASSGTTRVVIAVREDFFARLGAIDGLRDTYNRDVEVVATPDRDALARTLVAPLEMFDFAFEDPALLVAMVEAVESEPAALALLQFCADRLWDMRDRRWKRLTWEAYRAIGGVVGALAAHADGVLDAFNSAQRESARRLLLRLVTPERTRAVVARRALEEAGGEQAKVVIDRLVASRLVAVRDQGDDPNDSELELVHEALIAHWSTLQGFLGADEDGQRLAHALSRAAAEWTRRGTPVGLLWRGDALDDLRRWRRRASPPLTDEELRFADESERDEQRGRLIRRGLAAIALAATCAASVVLFVLWRDAVTARNRAEVRGLVAQAREREPRGESAEAAALYLTAGALDADGASVDVLVELERLGRGHTLGRELPGHDGPVWRVALSPDGTTLATASVDGTLRLWDRETGALRHRIGGHASIVEALLFSPDGATVATASGSLTEPRGEVFVWDVATGHQRARFDGHTAPVLRLAQGDGWLASASRDKTVRIWRDGAPPLVLMHPASLTALASVDAGLVSASGGNVYLWSAADGVGRGVLEGLGDGVVRLAASRQRARVIAGANRGNTRIWNANDSTLLLSIPQPSEAVAISVDGLLAATGHPDGVVRLWDVDGGVVLASLHGHSAAVSDLAFSEDGARLVSTARQELLVWSVTGRAVESRLVGHRDTIHDVALHGDRLLTGSADRSARLFTMEPRVSALYAGRDAVVAASPSPNGTLSLVVWPGEARVFRGKDAVSTVPLDSASAGAWLDDERWLALGAQGARIFGADGKLVSELANLRGHAVAVAGNRFAVLADERLVFGDAGARCAVEGVSDPKKAGILALSPAGDRVVIALGRMARIFDSACAPGPELRGHEADVAALTWTPDGQTVVTTSRHTARLWRVTDGASLHVLTGHERTVTAAAVSPDGQLLATASLDGKVRLFETESGETRATLSGPEGAVRQVVFSGDGARLASAGDDGEVWIWDTARAKLIERLPLGGGRVVRLTALGNALIAANESGVAALFDVPALDAGEAFRRLLGHTNFRVCRDDQTPHAVLPFPSMAELPGGTVPWAPAAVCR